MYPGVEFPWDVRGGVFSAKMYMPSPWSSQSEDAVRIRGREKRSHLRGFGPQFTYSVTFAHTPCSLLFSQIYFRKEQVHPLVIFMIIVGLHFTLYPVHRSLLYECLVPSLILTSSRPKLHPKLTMFLCTVGILGSDVTMTRLRSNLPLFDPGHMLHPTLKHLPRH